MTTEKRKPSTTVTVSEATKALADEAEAIEAILKNPNNIWGPAYVKVLVQTETGPIIGVFGQEEPWQEEWGPVERDFAVIAAAKLELAERMHMDTKDIGSNADFPDIIKGDDGKPYPGAVFRGDARAATSGAKSLADHDISGLVVSRITINRLQANVSFIGKCPVYGLCKTVDCPHNLDEYGEMKLLVHGRDEFSMRLSDPENHRVLSDGFIVRQNNGNISLVSPRYSFDVVRIVGSTA